jgi:putative endonuclease
MVTSNVLQSEKDGKFYTGFTSNLKLRFQQHNKGLVASTRDRGPCRLIYYEACLDQNDATKREKYLKTYHGKMFLKKRLKIEILIYGIFIVKFHYITWSDHRPTAPDPAAAVDCTETHKGDHHEFTEFIRFKPDENCVPAKNPVHGDAYRRKRFGSKRV